MALKCIISYDADLLEHWSVSGAKLEQEKFEQRGWGSKTVRLYVSRIVVTHFFAEKVRSYRLVFLLYQLKHIGNIFQPLYCDGVFMPCFSASECPIFLNR